MNRWSNPFVSLCALLLVTACQSGPRVREAPPTPATESAGKEAPAAPVAPATPAEAPVPAGAMQQYADALQLAKAGHTSDAEAEFQRLAAAYPALAGPEVNLGLLYLRGSRLPEAETALKAAVERNPGNAVAWNELGIVLRKLGKFSEAETAYQRTIATEPNYAPAYLNLGVLYDLYLGEPQKALDQFEDYIRIAGDNKQVAGWVIELRKRVGAASSAAKKEAS